MKIVLYIRKYKMLLKMVETLKTISYILEQQLM